MSTLSDEQLWQQILCDEPDAWKEIVLRYRSLVYSVCTFMRLSQADAADCFQQTWAMLYQHRRRLSDPNRLSSWLVTTARREAMRIRRRDRRFADQEPDATLDDQRLRPDEELEQLELQAHLEIALGRIDKPCNKLLSLFFFGQEDLSYEEIAEEMGLAPNTLGAKRRRCLEKLRSILSEMGYDRERNLE